MKNYMEEESKASIKESSVNFNCIKEEVIDLEIERNGHPKRYETAFENCDFLDNDMKVGTEYTKLEVDIKEDHLDCSKCNGNYKGYCIKCSALSRILNQTILLANSKCESNGIPKDVLEIRETSMRTGVFLLKTIPKNVLFGPFQGISAIKTTEGYGWLIYYNKLVNVHRANWMKNVRTMNVTLKNLDIFQFESNLYFKTDREITEGEELLVYINENEIKNSNGINRYLIPRKLEELPKILACTLCCLGFSSDKCLTEHKTKCPHSKYNRNNEDFEFTECYNCKIWLEKQEYEDYHMDYCWEMNLRFGDVLKSASKSTTNIVKIEEADCDLKNELDEAEKNLIKKSYIANKPKSHDGKDDLQIPIKVEDDNQTKEYPSDINKHTKAHNAGNGTRHQCTMCDHKFNQKEDLQRHMVIHGVLDSVNMHKCSDCSFETTLPGKLKKHIKKVHNIKSYRCDVCAIEFKVKRAFLKHMNKIHVKPKIKNDCEQCLHQIQQSGNLNIHLKAHSGVSKFKCIICMIKFCSKAGMRSHMFHKHKKGVRLLK